MNGICVRFTQRARQLMRPLLGPLCGFLVLIYFGYHLMAGERGLPTYWQVRDSVTQAEQRLHLLSQERAIWERRVHLLRADSLDLDLLEERAREVLSLGRQAEHHIIVPSR